MLSIGLMSGTSMDGIDATLLETDGDLNIKEIGHLSMTYDQKFKHELHTAQKLVRTYQGDLEKVQSLFPLDEVVQHSTYLHSEVVKQLLVKTNYKPHHIHVIGYHGQTMYHHPKEKISHILGNGQRLADLTSIQVVTDFRKRDIQAGGQGAPFAPLYHQALCIRDRIMPACVVNCGGIANVTLIRNDSPIDLVGFDTGPGNGLIDTFVRERTFGRENLDLNGQYGLKGKIHKDLIQKLFESSVKVNGLNFFDLKPPKSLDYGDLRLIPELQSLTLEDACRTLEAFTSLSIVDSIKHFDTQVPLTWILAGGGWHNPVIRQALESSLIARLGGKVKVVTSDEIGWHNQTLEAQIFAYFAVRSLQGKPLSVPGTTQVPYPMTGGQVFLPHTSQIG